MPRTTPWRHGAALLALAGACACAPAWAQETAKPAAKPTPKPAATPAAKAKAQPPGLPKAPGEQLAAAAMAHFGDYACEFNEVIKVTMNARNDGYIDVQHRKQSFTMRPILSSTGALRLEDVKGRMLMLQIADKSMLMDTRIGQRVVDKCVHEKQRDFVRPAEGAGLGIEPARVASGSGS